jgi:hypothetical protein
MVERPEQSPKGEATKFIAVAFAFQQPLKKISEPWRVFRSENVCVKTPPFHHANHHKLTTIYHQKNTPKSQKPLEKTPLYHAGEKSIPPSNIS